MNRIHTLSTASTDWVAIFSIAAAVTSIVLAVVAIVFAWLFFKETKADSQDIAATVKRLEAIVAYIRQDFVDAYTKASITQVGTGPVGTAEESELKAAELKRDVFDEVVKRYEDLRTKETRLTEPDLKAVVSHAIDKAAEAHAATIELAAREFILEQLDQASQEGSPVTVADVLLAGGSRFAGHVLIDEIMRLHRDGTILWSTIELEPRTELVLPSREVS